MLRDKKVLFALKNPPAERWIAGRLSADVKFGDPPEGWSPDAAVIVGRSPAGGVEDPAAVIEDLLTRGNCPVCVVVAARDPGTERRLRLLGVPEECLLWSDGAGVRPSEVLKRLEEAVEKDLRPEPAVFAPPEYEQEEPLLLAARRQALHGPEAVRGAASEPAGFGEASRVIGAAEPASGAQAAQHPNPQGLAQQPSPRGSVKWSALAPHRGRIVVVTGSGTGVGRTTLTAALAAHAASLGEKTAAVDLDPFPELALHLRKPQLLPVQEEGLERWLRGRTPYGDLYVPAGASDLDVFVLLGVLVSEGLTPVVDAPPGFAPWADFAGVVFVVGSDLRALDGAKERIPAGAVVIASRVQPADANVWPGVVGDALGVEPAAVLVEDPEGCRAAGARFAPVTESPGSTVLAKAVGELAPLLFKKEAIEKSATPD